MKTRITFMVAMMAIAISATAMPLSTAREEALFLSDKMAYELDLTESQYEAVYEINLDYLLNVDSRANMFGASWAIRDRDMRQVLTDWQYNDYQACEWFYRPVEWNANGLLLTIYNRYDRGRLFKHRPAVFISFRGGHNHKDISFYARHRFDKPNLRIHDRHRDRHLDRSRPTIVITDRHHPGDRGDRKSIGSRIPLIVNVGDKHHDHSVSVPTRSFGSHHSDKKMDRDDFKDSMKDASHRHFGGGRR